MTRLNSKNLLYMSQLAVKVPSLNLIYLFPESLLPRLTSKHEGNEDDLWLHFLLLIIKVLQLLESKK